MDMLALRAFAVHVLLLPLLACEYTLGVRGDGIPRPTLSVDSIRPRSRQIGSGKNPEVVRLCPTIRHTHSSRTNDVRIH
jgi:hypothetical protein